MNHALPNAALDQLFRSARSYNRWTTTPVPQTLIRELYELVKLGPTSANSSPARFVFVHSAEGKQRLADCVSANNRVKVEQAPVTVIIGMDLAFADRLGYLWPHDAGVGNWFRDPQISQATAMRNSSLQGAYLMLAARALGLDCGPMSGFDNAKVDAAFFAGTRVVSNFICGLGHGSTEALFPRHPRLSFEEACRFA